MAISTQAKYPHDLSIVANDGTGTPVSLTLVHTKGDVKLSGLRDVLNEIVKTEARGEFISAGTGKRIYPTLTLSMFLPSIGASAAPGSFLNFVMRDTPYTANLSTLGTGRPYAIQLVITIEGTDYGDAADHTFTCNSCALTSADVEESEDGFSGTFNFEILGSISGDITATEH